MGTWTNFPSGSCVAIPFWMKSPSILGPKLVNLTLVPLIMALNFSAGILRRHWREFVEFAQPASLEMESYVDWDLSPVSPWPFHVGFPLCIIAPRNNLSSRPPYAVRWKPTLPAPALSPKITTRCGSPSTSLANSLEEETKRMNVMTNLQMLQYFPWPSAKLIFGLEGPC